MAVQNPEAPCREDQQCRAGKEDLHQEDGELPLLALESRGDQANEPRRSPYAERDEYGGDEEKKSEDGFRKLRCLFMPILGAKPCIHGDEGSGEDTFSEEILQEVRDAEGGAKDVGRVGVSKIMREDPVTDEADEPAEQDSGADCGGMAASGCSLGLGGQTTIIGFAGSFLP